MPRTFRAIAVGYPHHVTQRVNYRENIFFDDQDRRTYLEYLNNVGAPKNECPFYVSQS